MHRSLLAAAAAVLLLAPVAASAQDDVGAASEAICCGAECCAIPEGDGCQARNEVNPANACEVCDPSMSQSGWTAMAGCADDAGSTGGTDAGTTPTDDGGCAVSPGGSSHAGMALGLVALGALFVRRRFS